MSVRVRPPAPTSKSAPLREECGRFSYARRACTSGHRKKTRTAPQAQGAFASARRGQCRKAFPPDTHAPSGFTHSPCLHERRHKKKDRAAPSAHKAQRGVGKKETVRSTVAFASAERWRTLRVLHRHCAVRARANIKRPDGAMPARNNTNQPQSNSFRRFCTAETCQYVYYCLRSARATSSENLLL